MTNLRVVPVRLDPPDNRQIDRAFAIMKDRIEARTAVRVVRGTDNPEIVLTLSQGLGEEAFRIAAAGAVVRVAGGSPRGLLYGVGKFLRTSLYDPEFCPSPWRGESAPQGTLRGMYYANHFHNWYHTASELEIVRYTEDMALWGANALMAIYPTINLDGWHDPESGPALDRLLCCARAARDLGMMFVTAGGNTLFRGTPKGLLATPLPDPLHRRGNSGHPVCPSNPEGMALILDVFERLFDRLGETGLDLLCLWPYDEGGCACPRCLPWGSNGFLRVSRALADLARKRFPNLKVILSTWTFDTPPEGEWEGLARSLHRDGGWVDYILADSHEDFPRYPLEAGVPGDKPMVNFPEISMWGNWPWGGYGAHVLPGRLQRIWDQAGHALAGGFPYSEGIYEDMAKAISLQFYWDRIRTARDTLREYAAYEFSPDVVDDTVAIIDMLEAAATAAMLRQPVDASQARRARDMAEAVDRRLPDWARRNWRWEIVRLRAALDVERFAGGSLESPEAQIALRRLIDIYHCQVQATDPYHHRVRPPLKAGESAVKL